MAQTNMDSESVFGMQFKLDNSSIHHRDANKIEGDSENTSKIYDFFQKLNFK